MNWCVTIFAEDGIILGLFLGVIFKKEKKEDKEEKKIRLEKEKVEEQNMFDDDLV